MLTSLRTHEEHNDLQYGSQLR